MELLIAHCNRTLNSEKKWSSIETGFGVKLGSYTILTATAGWPN